MTYPCPKGCHSIDPVRCSKCGAAMRPPADHTGPNQSKGSPSGASQTPCPNCGAARHDPSARYCEVCRHEFETAQSFAAPAAGSRMPSPPAPPPLTSAPPVRRWNALITIDPSLDPEAAGSHPPQQRRIFPLELAENLIGRRSNSLGVHPEIALDGDPGVSRRHARIFFGPDGAPVLLELGSANGTLLNGQPVEPGAPTPLADGDQLSLGRCTRITIKSY